MERRLKLATVWLGGCSGCHMSFLDLDEFLIELVEKVDIVFTPVIDTKRYPVWSTARACGESSSRGRLPLRSTWR